MKFFGRSSKTLGYSEEELNNFAYNQLADTAKSHKRHARVNSFISGILGLTSAGTFTASGVITLANFLSGAPPVMPVVFAAIGCAHAFSSYAYMKSAKINRIQSHQLTKEQGRREGIAETMDHRGISRATAPAGFLPPAQKI